MPNGHTDKERLVALEVGLRDLRDDVQKGQADLMDKFVKIETNHLPHIQASVDRLLYAVGIFMLLYLFGPEAIHQIKTVLGL